MIIILAESLALAILEATVELRISPQSRKGRKGRKGTQRDAKGRKAKKAIANIYKTAKPG